MRRTITLEIDPDALRNRLRELDGNAFSLGVRLAELATMPLNSIDQRGLASYGIRLQDGGDDD